MCPKSLKGRPADADPATTPIHVLLVEDDEDDYVLVRSLPAEIGRDRYTLDWVSSFDGVADTAASGSHDVCLLDYHLGRHDGLELLQTHALGDVPVILITGAGDRELDVRAMQMGAADYLAKGEFDAALLERAIRYALQHRRSEDALRRANDELEERVQERTARLQEANRRKDEFLAMLGHELRNPLAAVQNGFRLLQSNGLDQPTAGQVGHLVETQVKQLVRLVDDLLEASRVTQGKITLRKTKIDVSEAVRQAVEVIRPAAEAKGHSLKVSLPSQPVYLEADAARLQQVVVNLLDNAVKFTSRGGHISVDAGREKGDAVVYVRDDGVGIQPQMLPRIFEVFAQGGAPADRAPGGLGIGLALARSLVEMHGGTLIGSSAGQGKGSEFVVRLPALADVAAEPMVPAPEPSHRATGRRILLAEDSPAMARILQMLLELWGHRVRVAHDGPSALECFEAYEPEVVLLDIGLPGMNGHEVARRIRKQQGLKKPVIVAMTGFGQEEDRRRSLDAGCDLHLTKPVDPPKLQELLASLPLP